MLRSLTGLKHPAQFGVMGVVYGRIVQRPRLRRLEYDRHCRKCQLAIVLIFGGSLIEVSFCGQNANPAHHQHEILQRLSRGEPLLEAALHRGILDPGELLDEVPQLAANSVYGQEPGLPYQERSRNR
jgi:hypothetical protein